MQAVVLTASRLSIETEIFLTLFKKKRGFEIPACEKEKKNVFRGIVEKKSRAKRWVVCCLYCRSEQTGSHLRKASCQHHITSLHVIDKQKVRKEKKGKKRMDDRIGLSCFAFSSIMPIFLLQCPFTSQQQQQQQQQQDPEERRKGYKYKILC